MTALDILCLKENKYYTLNKTLAVNDELLEYELVVDDQSECELASMLYDVTKKNHTYCGLQPIALAMLTGKLNLTAMFLKKDTKVINKIILHLGTLLTLLLNPIYNLNLSYNELNELLDLLLRANANPLTIVEISDQKFRGNVYDYCFILSETKRY